MARLYEKEYYFKDLEDGEMGQIIHDCAYKSLIIIKVQGKDLVQALYSIHSWVNLDEISLKIRKLTKKEAGKILMDYPKGDDGGVCAAKDLNNGEKAVIIDNGYSNIKGDIVIKINNVLYSLKDGNYWKMAGSSTMQVRKLKPGELIEIT